VVLPIKIHQTQGLRAECRIYVWKTDSAWAGTCRQLLVTLNDGTQHIAYFQFTK